MANYVNKDILCQAYIHIEPVGMTEEKLEAFNQVISEFIDKRGKFFVYDTIDTDLTFKEGSLKVYATIVGSIYIAISQYGSFRSGVDYLAADAKRLSDVIISECLFQTKSRHSDIIRVEARVGVIGQIKVIIDEIRSINSEINSKSAKHLANRLVRLEDLVVKMESNLKDPSDAPYVKQNLCSIFNELIPEEPKRVPNTPFDEQSKIFYIEARRKLISVLQ